MKFSPHTRLAFALINLAWFGYALVRVTAWVKGHPGDPVSLAFVVVAGVAGLVGFCAFALQRKTTNPDGRADS